MPDINQWLDTLDLGQYTEVFAENDIDLEVLPELAEEDLEKLGVSMGHRKKLLKAIAALVAPEHEARPDAASQPATPDDSSIPPPSPSPTTSRPADAERRQLTVEFCDLVGSTALSGQLDPEDLREVVRAYQEVAAEAIHRYEGHIAQYLGDGLLIYSGYPQAHEDDPERAIRIGLGIVEAIEHLNPRLEQQYGIRLAVRVGIHTGPVVVGEMGGGGRHEQLALGETPNIAARLEGLAASNQVVASDATRRLVGGTFDVEDLGTHAMKGVAEPMQVYGIRGERAVESRFDAATVTGLTPLVGREEEVDLVMRRWEQSREGEGQVVLPCGEPGIGKSRLTQTLRERVTQEPHIRVRYQCSPYYINSAFYPIITQLERAAQFTRSDTPDEKLVKLEALLGQATTQVTDVAPLFAALLTIPPGDRYPPLSLTPQRQKEKIIEALVDQLVGLAQQRPVLFVFEDAHWSDPTSLEVFDLLIHRVADVPVLVVITYRPEFEPPWGGFAHVTTHALNRLTRRQVATLVTGVTGGKTLPDAVLDQIAAKTDGVPLFVEELTKTVLEGGFLHEAGEHYDLIGPLPPLAIPATLQDALMARLDRLAPVKEVAQIGAVLGREFTYELVAAVSPLQDTMLQDALDQLVSAELLFRRGTPPTAAYLFKHALVQDTAYTSLLKSRRQQLHTRIAQVFEAQFPEQVEAEPELLAHHYMEAGLSEPAIAYWQRAGERAIVHSAHVEAIQHLTQGLSLLKTLPDFAEHTQQELTFQTQLGQALIAIKGFAAPEVETVFTRARDLLAQVGQPAQMAAVVWGLWVYYLTQGNFSEARKMGETLLDLAEREHNPGFRLQGHIVLGWLDIFVGNFVAARAHLEQGISLYDSEEHRDHRVLYGFDPGVACLTWQAWALWFLGYPDQALAKSREALTLVRAMSHPVSLVAILAWNAIFYYYRRETHVTLPLAKELVAVSTELAYALRLAEGNMVLGWALADTYLGAGEESHRGQEGIELTRQGLVHWQATGAKLGIPIFSTMLVDAYRVAGACTEGLRALSEAFSVMEQTGECLHESQMLRLKGELLLAQSSAHQPEAEACFREAIEVARHQHAKSLELRAAMSLSRLWQQQGKCDEARDLLAPVYGWFTEGFDTADLQEAKMLLEELEA